jgi:hypothetical protein
VTSSWFFLSTLNYDSRSTTHQNATVCTVNIHINVRSNSATEKCDGRVHCQRMMQVHGKGYIYATWSKKTCIFTWQRATFSNIYNLSSEILQIERHLRPTRSKIRFTPTAFFWVHVHTKFHQNPLSHFRLENVWPDCWPGKHGLSTEYSSWCSMYRGNWLRFCIESLFFFFTVVDRTLLNVLCPAHSSVQYRRIVITAQYGMFCAIWYRQSVILSTRRLGKQL